MDMDLLAAIHQVASWLNLPSLLIKAFMATEGANVTHPDGVLPVLAGTRRRLYPAILRQHRLLALGRAVSDPMDGGALNAEMEQAFRNRNLLVQVLTGAHLIRDLVNRNHGWVALAGVGYNAGTAQPARTVAHFGRDMRHAAQQFHKRLGSGQSDVRVDRSEERFDPAIGNYTHHVVVANDSGLEIFPYQYLRRVPGRAHGLLDFLFAPRLMASRSLFEGEAAPGADDGSAVLLATGQLRCIPASTTYKTVVTLALSQRDPRWAAEPLGKRAPPTQADGGSALTALTMLMNTRGANETPALLNAKLAAMPAGEGFAQSAIAWDAPTRMLPALGAANASACADFPAPLGDVEAALLDGRPALLELSQSPTSFTTHWVMVCGKRVDDYLILDPWPLPAATQPAVLTERYPLQHPGDGVWALPVTVLTYGESTAPAPARLQVRVKHHADVLGVGGLALRANPLAGSTLLQRLPAGTLLRPFAAEPEVRAQLNMAGGWLNVAAPDGTPGHVFAMYVEMVRSRAGSRGAGVQRALRRKRRQPTHTI